jgi:hypothetical protein
MRHLRIITASLIMAASLAGCVYGGYGHHGGYGYGGGYGGGYHHHYNGW